MSKKVIEPENRPLTVKQKKFVSEIVKGAPKYKAYEKAGYSVSTKEMARSESSRLSTKPNITKAINDALNKVGATPEFAVQVLADVAGQEKEVGARRLAAKDILELHGWRKDERPQSVLQINNSFFSDVMPSKSDEVIDV